MTLTKQDEYKINNQKLYICKVCGTYFKSEEESPNCCIYCEKELEHLEVDIDGKEKSD